MDANLQRCNVCKKVNTEEATDWVRLGGASNDKRQPHRPIMLDFCSDCAGKTPVKDVPALMPALPQAPGPRLVGKPPTAPVSN